MLTDAAHDGDLLRFAAAGDWTCSYLVWFERALPLADERLAVALRQGVKLIDEGPLRKSARAMLSSGLVEAVTLGHDEVASLAWNLRVLGSPLAASFERGGALLEVRASGRLGPALEPLWISLAAACSVAVEGGGCVIEPGTLRELDRCMLRARIPARARIALGEHFLVLSSVSPDGAGLITTSGLRRLGMPELVARDLPPETLFGFGSILCGLAWYLHDRVVKAPTVGADREVAVSAEILFQPAWCERAFGHRSEHPRRVSLGPFGPPLVRLGEEADDVAEWIVLDPPRSWTSGRAAWARTLVLRSRLLLLHPSDLPLEEAAPRDGTGPH